MPIPASFTALAEHPAPGLRFADDPSAGVTACTIPTPHDFGEPSSLEAIAELRNRTAACPAVQAELLEFYSRWNGAALCCARDPDTDEECPSLIILPIEQWEEWTPELPYEESLVPEDLEDLYVPGHYFTVAISPGEDTRLLLFTEGTRDEQALAGKIFYLSLDPVLSPDCPIAGSVFGLLDEIGTDPAKFFARIGVNHVVPSEEEPVYGAVADQYLADCGQPD